MLIWAPDWKIVDPSFNTTVERDSNIKYPILIQISWCDVIIMSCLGIMTEVTERSMKQQPQCFKASSPPTVPKDACFGYFMYDMFFHTKAQLLFSFSIIEIIYESANVHFKSARQCMSWYCWCLVYLRHLTLHEVDFTAWWKAAVAWKVQKPIKMESVYRNGFQITDMALQL